MPVPNDRNAPVMPTPISVRSSRFAITSAPTASAASRIGRGRSANLLARNPITPIRSVPAFTSVMIDGARPSMIAPAMFRNELFAESNVAVIPPEPFTCSISPPNAAVVPLMPCVPFSRPSTSQSIAWSASMRPFVMSFCRAPAVLPAWFARICSAGTPRSDSCSSSSDWTRPFAEIWEIAVTMPFIFSTPPPVPRAVSPRVRRIGMTFSVSMPNASMR